MSERTPRRQHFLDQHGWHGIAPVALSGDASSRNYARLRRPADAGGPASAILMDDPTTPNQVATFVRIADCLRGCALSAPEIYAADAADGFALIEDFGDTCFARLIDGGTAPRPLFDLAVDALITVHRHVSSDGTGPPLPQFTPALFLEQARLFLDVYMPAVRGHVVDAAARDTFDRAWRTPLEAACAVPQSLLLRDFFVGNLMHLPERPGVQACGLLDFQDAGIGPVSYDLASLIEDARRDVTAEIADAAVARYLSAFTTLDGATFARSLAVMAAVRHVRVIAVFTRLALSHGKAGYLQHIPRVWRLLEAQLETPALAAVKQWFDMELPPARRIAPKVD